ncbi:MAG: biotin/lipoyl-containing protein [Bdellovibrionota bacterium]
MDKKFTINGQEVTVNDFRKNAEFVSFELNGKKYDYKLISKEGAEIIFEGQGRIKANAAKPNRDGETLVMVLGREGTIYVAGKTAKKAVATGSLVSPMPGKIFKVIKEVGSSVVKGEAILILEAMKMEHSIRADKDGKVKKIMFKTGELVQGGVILAEVE